MAFSNAPQYSTYQQKTIPFYGEPLLRDGFTPKDQRFYNCFPESYKTPNSDQKTFYLRKRFGLEFILGVPSGVFRGTMTYEGVMYWCTDSTIYKYDGTTPSAIGSLSTSTGPVGMQPFFYNGDDQQYILIADGTALYTYQLSSGTYAVHPGGYPTPHSPYFEVMDGYILMVKAGTGDMYNSQLSDWTQPWDFLSAEMYPDKLIGLRRFNNYIMAIGSETMEMFYDAANEDGSPFARNDSVIATIGCIAPGTAIQTDRKFMWLGTTQEGDVSVWTMDEFKPVEIATPAVKMALTRNYNTLPDTTAYSARCQGHQWYVLCLADATWVFDVIEKIWVQWDYNNGGLWPVKGGGEVTPGRYYGIIPDGSIVRFNDVAYIDLAAFPIQVRWQTEGMTMETMNRKFLNRLSIIGDRSENPVNILVQWSDDDFITFSPGRVLDMSKFRPAIVNLGYFRKRAFRFSTSDITPMRLESMELNFNTGVN